MILFEPAQNRPDGVKGLHGRVVDLGQNRHGSFFKLFHVHALIDERLIEVPLKEFQKLFPAARERLADGV